MKTFLLISLFIASSLSMLAQNIAVNKPKKDGLQLQAGAGIGFAAGSLSYISIASESSSSSTMGTNSDILNEYKVFVDAKFNETFGVGAEFGRLTYFQVSEIASGGFGSGITNTISDYMSGMYISPYLMIDKFRVGMTYMSPTPSTWFARSNDNIASDQNYEDLTPASQKVFDEFVRSYLNVYVGYNHQIDNAFVVPIDIWGKVGYDLQNPFNYENVEGITMKSNFRLFMTLGVNIKFDIL